MKKVAIVIGAIAVLGTCVLVYAFYHWRDGEGNITTYRRSYDSPYRHGLHPEDSNVLESTGHAVGDTVGSAGRGAANIVESTGRAVGDTAHSVGHGVGRTVESAGEGAANIVESTGQAVGDTVESVGEGTSNVIRSIFN